MESLRTHDGKAILRMKNKIGVMMLVDFKLQFTAVDTHTNGTESKAQK